MFLQNRNLKLNQVTEADGGGSIPTPDSVVDKETNEINDMYGDQSNELGTPATPAAVTPPATTPPVVEPPAEQTAPSVTGYGDKPAEEKPAEAAAPKSEEKPAEAAVVEFNAEGLDDKSKTYIETFAKDHKLSKEATQAFADQIKAQNETIAKVAETYLKMQDERKQATEKAWGEELKNDPNFGGENFDRNLKRVDVVLDKLFPNAKIYLQNSKQTLHPSAMKDLLSFYDTVLGGDNKVVTPQNGVQTEWTLDDFYK